MTEAEFQRTLDDYEATKVWTALFPDMKTHAGSWEIDRGVAFNDNVSCYAGANVHFRGNYHPRPGVNVPEDMGMGPLVEKDLDQPGSYTISFNGPTNATDLTFDTAIGRFKIVHDRDRSLSREQFERLASQPIRLYYEGQPVPPITGDARVVSALDECNTRAKQALAEWLKYVHSRYLEYLKAQAE